MHVFETHWDLQVKAGANTPEMVAKCTTGNDGVKEENG